MVYDNVKEDHRIFANLLHEGGSLSEAILSRPDLA